MKAEREREKGYAKATKGDKKKTHKRQKGDREETLSYRNSEIAKSAKPATDVPLSVLTATPTLASCSIGASLPPSPAHTPEDKETLHNDVRERDKRKTEKRERGRRKGDRRKEDKRKGDRRQGDRRRADRGRANT